MKKFLLILLLITISYSASVFAAQLILDEEEAEESISSLPQKSPLEFFAGFLAGIHPGYRNSQSTEPGLYEKINFFGQMVFDREGNHFFHSMILELGYHKMPLMLDYGIIRSDSVFSAFSYQGALNLFNDFNVTLSGGAGISRLVSFHYFSEETQNTYKIHVRPWIYFFKLALGCEFNLLQYGVLLFETGIHYFPISYYKNQFLYISGEDYSAHDATLKEQAGMIFFLSLGWKMSLFS